MLAVEDYDAWLAEARPGEEVVYYQTSRLPVPEYALGRYRRLLARVYESSVDRQVILAQRRVQLGGDSGQLAYVARKVSSSAPEHLFPKSNPEALCQ